MCHKVSINFFCLMTEIQQWIVQNICIKNWLLVNVCYIITLGNWTVGIQFSKVNDKNHPFFLDFENLRFPLKKYPFFGEMGTSIDVRFGRDWRDRAGMGSPIGGSPTTLQWRHTGLDGVSTQQPQLVTPCGIIDLVKHLYKLWNIVNSNLRNKLQSKPKWN